jgi:hypothetical protein
MSAREISPLVPEKQAHDPGSQFNVVFALAALDGVAPKVAQIVKKEGRP